MTLALGAPERILPPLAERHVATTGCAVEGIRLGRALLVAPLDEIRDRALGTLALRGCPVVLVTHLSLLWACVDRVSAGDSLWQLLDAQPATGSARRRAKGERRV